MPGAAVVVVAGVDVGPATDEVDEGEVGAGALVDDGDLEAGALVDDGEVDDGALLDEGV